jgi:hypothetical protein
MPPRLRAAQEKLVAEPMDWKLLQERGNEWMRHWDENVRNRGGK